MNVSGVALPPSPVREFTVDVGRVSYSERMRAAPEVHELLDSLVEDRSAAWIPDPLGHVDAEGAVACALADGPKGAFGELELLSVPKPDGSSLTAPLLSVGDLALLRRAVAPLAEPLDASLLPGVCGYRRGAEAGSSYSREHRRFVEFSESEAESAPYVIVADVQKFFVRTTWDRVLCAARTLVDDSLLAGLEDFAARAADEGLPHIPAGYADARLLGNLILSSIDRSVDLPLARWVDDYRIFAASQGDANEAIAQMRAALSEIGLALNTPKTRIWSTFRWNARDASSLDSVYHPDVESPDKVRASLRGVFIKAVSAPRPNRRHIRFALPRLAEQGDPIAIEWALNALKESPWEAPRTVAYLAAFIDRPDVQQGVETRLVEALSEQQVWVAIRLAALACRMNLSAATSDRLAGHLQTTQSPALWSMLIRALALNGNGRPVVREIESRVLSPRAAVAALRDVGEAVSADLAVRAPEAVDATRQQTAPLPQLETIL